MIMSFFYCIVLSVFFSTCTGFNLVPDSDYVIRDPSDAVDEIGNHFGFTVALARDEERSRVVVGAPRSNSSYQAHTMLHNPGLTYTCSLDGDRSCEPLLLDRSGNQPGVTDSSQYYQDKKDNMMLGAAVDALNDDIVICGPKWKNQKYDGFYLLNGVCYFLHGKLTTVDEAEKLLPLVHKDKQGQDVDGGANRKFYYSYGEAGFSVHLTKDKKHLIMGAPGVYNWLGSVVKYELASGIPVHPFVPNPKYFPDETGIEYFGYSVASGYFWNTQEVQYVASAPRSNEYRGEVFLFQFPSSTEQPLVIKTRLKGSVMGEYFGSGLCVIDLNNDGLDDLIVGAPLYSDKTHGDQGRVYVYINEQNGVMKEVTGDGVVSGSKTNGARFGTAISVIGDVNLDGYKDVVVGAPYEGVGGCVYLYHGSPNGKIKQVQRITASSIDPTLRGFGYSLSRGMDVDNNKYPDIAVGAFESGSVVVITSRPVIHFTPRIKSETSMISFAEIEQQLIVDVCLAYNGLHSSNTVDVEVSVILDKDDKRLVFFNRNHEYSYNITLNRDVESCQSVQVLTKILSEIPVRNIFKPVDFLMKYQILTPPVRCITCPVTDPSVANQIELKLPVKTLCGGTEKNCEPLLVISPRIANPSLPVVVGSSNTMILEVEIHNLSPHPGFIDYIDFKLSSPMFLKKTLDVCSNSSNTQTNFKCYNGQFINKNQSLLMVLTIDISLFDSSTKDQHINMTILPVSSNPITNVTSVTLDIPLTFRSVVFIRGVSKPSWFVSRNEQHQQANHTYSIVNHGPSTLTRMTIRVLLPYLVADSRTKFLDVVEPQVYIRDEVYLCNSTYNEWLLLEQYEVSSPSSRRRRSLFPVSCQGLPNVECIDIMCHVGTMAKGTEAELMLKMKIYPSILKTEEWNKPKMSVNTTVTAVYTDDPAVVLSTLTVGTVIDFQTVLEKETPLLWLYILIGVIIAVAILTAVILILRKMKFFERKKSQTEAETEILITEKEGKNADLNLQSEESSKQPDQVFTNISQTVNNNTSLQNDEDHIPTPISNPSVDNKPKITDVTSESKPPQQQATESSPTTDDEEDKDHNTSSQNDEDHVPTPISNPSADNKPKITGAILKSNQPYNKDHVTNIGEV